MTEDAAGAEIRDLEGVRRRAIGAADRLRAVEWMQRAHRAWAPGAASTSSQAVPTHAPELPGSANRRRVAHPFQTGAFGRVAYEVPPWIQSGPFPQKRRVAFFG